MLICGHYTLMYLGLLHVYLQSHADIYHCIVLMGGWFFHLGIQYSTFVIGIMYFGHHVTPMTSHNRGASVIVDFTTLGRSCFYDLPCPYADSLDPLFSSYTLMSQESPQKTHVYVYTRLLKQYPCVHTAFEPILTYIGKCT